MGGGVVAVNMSSKLSLVVLDDELDDVDEDDCFLVFVLLLLCDTKEDGLMLMTCFVRLPTLPTDDWPS